MSTGSTTAETGAARFTRQVALTLLARLLIAGSSLVAGVIVARWLGPASVGILASLTVLTLLSVTFGGLGLPSAITFLVARDRRGAFSVWLNAVIFALSFGAALAIGISILSDMVPSLFGDAGTFLVTVTAVAVPFHLLNAFCLSTLLGFGKIERYNAIDSLSQFLVVLNPLVTLGLLGMGLTALVLLNAATSILVALLVAAVVFRQMRSTTGEIAWRIDRQVGDEMFRYAAKFYIVMLAGVIILRADLLFVNYFRGAAEAGVYAVSTQVGTLLMLVPSVISTVLFPQLTSSNDTSGEMTCRVTRHTAVIMFVICIAIIPVSFLLPLLYGPAFSAVPYQVLILLPGVYLFGLEAVQVQYFNGIGLPRAIPVFWICTVALNIAFNLALVPTYGATGAAMVSSVSYALMFLFIATYFRSKTGRTWSGAFVIKTSELGDLVRMWRKLIPRVDEI